MGFRFSLESLLRLRRGAERAAELRLAALNAARAETAGMLAACDREAAAAGQHLNREMQTGLYGTEIQFQAEYARVLDRRRLELIRRKQQIEQEIQLQRRVLELARRQREILEKLRENQERDFIQRQERRMQAQADELFLNRRDR